VQMPTTAEREEVHDLLCRFFLCFDERDWTAMETVLAAEVNVDYASSGREAPSRMSGPAFVGRRRDAVDSLSKQHSFSNLHLAATPEGLQARCNYLILRFAKGPVAEGEDFFHSCGAYVFAFTREGGRLKISGITQRALRSWGNRDLHTGSRMSAAG
jgi:hypothetical protein